MVKISSVEMKLYTPSFKRMIKQYEDWHRVMQDAISPSMQGLLKHQASMEQFGAKWISELLPKSLYSGILKDQELLTQISNMYSIRILEGLPSNQFLKLQEVFAQYDQLLGKHSAFFCSLTKQMPHFMPGTVPIEYVWPLEELAAKGDLEPILAAIEEVIPAIEGSGSNATKMSALFTVLSLLISIWFSLLFNAESSEEMEDRFDALGSRIEQAVERNASIQQNETFYVVKRAVHLRGGPGTKDAILRLLLPGENVRLIDRQSKWIEVEYYDYKNDTVLTGWVYKKYLKMRQRARW